MITVTNKTAYSKALALLKKHGDSNGNRFKGRFVQIFLGAKFFENEIPSMHSGSFIRISVIESLLDDLYAKMSRKPTEAVLSLFENRHLARTGLLKPGHSDKQNTWRNNFGLQKGMVCFAPVSDLSSATFIEQDRSECKHLKKFGVSGLAGSSCSLCPRSSKYRNESQPKWLRVDSNGAGFATIDMQMISNFAPVVSHNGNRIPILPLVIALYHDSDSGLAVGNRQTVSRQDFTTDFHFSDQEFGTYFETDPAHPLNAAMLAPAKMTAKELLSWCSILAQAEPTPLAKKRQKPKVGLPAPILSGTPAPPPTANDGWQAEQFVSSLLSADGWEVYDTSRQQLGYDLFAQKGKRKRYVEVKSSLATCSPSLTAREWQQAKVHGNEYILAIVEKFKPTEENTVYWIPDPSARCVATMQRTVSHVIPRTSWITATVAISSL